MQNPKTTLMGYLVMLGAAAYLVSHALAGTLTLNDLSAVAGLAAGAGLVGAQDGTH